MALSGLEVPEASRLSSREHLALASLASRVSSLKQLALASCSLSLPTTRTCKCSSLKHLGLANASYYTSRNHLVQVYKCKHWERALVYRSSSLER